MCLYFIRHRRLQITLQNLKILIKLRLAGKWVYWNIHQVFSNHFFLILFICLSSCFCNCFHYFLDFKSFIEGIRESTSWGFESHSLCEYLCINLDYHIGFSLFLYFLIFVKFILWALKFGIYTSLFHTIHTYLKNFNLLSCANSRFDYFKIEFEKIDCLRGC